MAAYYWVSCSGCSHVPSTALQGGVDIDGQQIYVGRAHHDGDLLPAKVIPGKHVAYVAHGGREHAKNNFEVLCEQRFDWAPNHGGRIPPNAVEGGRTRTGETLYIGRVYHYGSHTVGKVHPSHGSCYIPFAGKEIPYKDYEILVLRAYYWVPCSGRSDVPSTALQGGVDVDGHQIYVGRAHHEGDLLPAKVIPRKHVAYVSYGGGEHTKHNFEVLCEQRFDWIKNHGGKMPPNAVEGGKTSSGETLYIGRVHHSGSHTVGKVHPSHGSCYIPFGGRELAYKDYEILVLRG